jgi:virginiamycin A acetyltransferase
MGEQPNLPDPNTVYPVEGALVTNVKPTVTRANIEVGDFTYFSDENFENHVTHHYEFYGDKLIIGKFCQIAAGVEFVMNGANHQMNAVSTFPFYIVGFTKDVPPLTEMPVKGDTVIGNDVWIGQNATILAGVHIGDGAIIGANATVASDVAPYTIAVGNPAGAVRKRFDDELIDLMLRFRWWDKPVEEIQQLIPLLGNSDLEQVKHEIKERL